LDKINKAPDSRFELGAFHLEQLHFRIVKLITLKKSTVLLPQLT